MIQLKNSIHHYNSYTVVPLPDLVIDKGAHLLILGLSGSGVTLSLRLDNLLNEKYRDDLSRVENRDAPMPGTNLNVMLRWDF